MPTITSATLLRKEYSRLIDALLVMGDRAQAQACAELAVQNGVWRHPQQRPTDFHESLPQLPLYDTADLWFVRYLEDQFPIIRDEVLRVVEPSAEGFSPVEEPLVGRGRWEEMIFYEGGIRMERSCALFPETAAIVSRISEAVMSTGVIMLSWLHPNTHIVPHCGATNSRLRVHLGIRVPDGASMRVGDKHIVWREGRCLVFDDSFEHEVWNKSSQPRVVLLFDIVHPMLPLSALGTTGEASDVLEEKAKAFLQSRGISAIDRDCASDELTIFPDRETRLTILRYMKDHGATSVELAEGRLHIERN